MFSNNWEPNERGPTPFVKLCLLGGSDLACNEWFVAISTKGACEGDWLGELDVVSDEEVVFGEVVVVEEDDDEIFSLANFVLSNTCFASSVTLFLLFVDWQAADISIGNKGDASSGVGGATLLWVGCELENKKYKINYILPFSKCLT